MGAGEEEELSFTPWDSLSKGWKDGWPKMGEELGRGLSFLLYWNELVSGSETPLCCRRQGDSRLGLNPDSRLLIVPFSQVTWTPMLCFVFCKVGIRATPGECTGTFPQSVKSFTVVVNAYHKQSSQMLTFLRTWLAFPSFSSAQPREVLQLASTHL